MVGMKAGQKEAKGRSWKETRRPVEALPKTNLFEEIGNLSPSGSNVRIRIRRDLIKQGGGKVDQSNKPDYIKEAPPPEADDASQLRMRDDFNTKVKTAKIETLARGKSATLQLATYRALLRNVDLLNPELSQDERLTRARRLVRAYERVRERRPKFHDDGAQLRAARSIINRFQYQQKLKREAAHRLAAG
jgi:hypothetical protein